MTFAALCLTHAFLVAFLLLGSGPDRGRSPVEWGDFPFVHPFVCSSPPLWAIFSSFILSFYLLYFLSFFTSAFLPLVHSSLFSFLIRICKLILLFLLLMAAQKRVMSYDMQRIFVHTTHPRPDQAPAGPWAQSGVRGTHGPSQSLYEIDWSSVFVYCLFYKPIDFSLSPPYFFSLLFLLFPLFFISILSCFWLF